MRSLCVFCGSNPGRQPAYMDWVRTLGVAHQGLTELHVVGSMHERKALMAELSDGFIALPAALGTLDEFAEVVTSSQLEAFPPGRHASA
jgi:predicted Rossmann-fold nucleotide-binding protein